MKSTSVITAFKSSGTIPRSMPSLMEAWRPQQLTKSPFVLDADRETLASGVHTVQYSTLDDYTSSPEFANSNDTTLHLGLVPMPFVGDLQSADVFLVLLNPGLGPLDYYGEQNEPGYREALLANLVSDRNALRDGFMFLNPKFAWTGGFRYRSCPGVDTERL